MQMESKLLLREKFSNWNIQSHWLYALPGVAYNGNSTALEPVVVQKPGHPKATSPSRWFRVEISLSLQPGDSERCHHLPQPDVCQGHTHTYTHTPTWCSLSLQTQKFHLALSRLPAPAPLPRPALFERTLCNDDGNVLDQGSPNPGPRTGTVCGLLATGLHSRR